MSRSYRQGLLVGVLGPLAFLGGMVYWIYRCTGKLPFPVRRVEEGELVIRLVDPEQVPTYWQQWKEDLDPLLDRLRTLGRELRDRCATCCERRRQ